MSRGVLVWGLCGCLFLCVTLIFLNSSSNNESRIREELARKMEDGEGPVIDLIGGDKMTIALGDALVEPGFDVYDTRSLPNLEIESLVDTKQVGEYEILYRATDLSGNVTEKKRSVKVVEPAGRIFLTFDDGPSEYTGALLDVLAKHNVKATFFVTGYGDDAIIAREFNEGHAVGIHTFSHVYANIYTSLDNYMADFNLAKERIATLTGQQPKLMRFPGGSSNAISSYYDGGTHIMSRLVNLLSESGYSYFDWNVDSGDAGSASSTDEVYNNVVGALKQGGDSVILQHDTKPYSVEAVERIIQYGMDNNYIFSKLSEDSFGAHHGVNN